MRCEDLEQLLDDHTDAELTPLQRQAVDAHLISCTDCNSSWIATRALRSYRALPAPAGTPFLLQEIADAKPRPLRHPRRRMPSWAAASLGGALAATIALLAIYVHRENQENRARTIPALKMSLNETRDVSVNIDSAEALMDVEVRVVLAGGIELRDFRGRSELRWKTDLEPGINRLTLPIVASDGSGGKVLIAVGHGDLERAFVVEIDVADDGDTGKGI